ncbi:PspA-associated protein PspAB [Dactylosporangium sp. CA-139066]|uniref:PspA-associated protein PspAB n=1 Tax=Dactylosporangium sp. CA-139066 TaxID=3239930 RepID=UPI003D8C51AE
MKFLDALLGRTKPVQPDLDALFAVPAAATTLQAALGLTPTGVGAVCFKAAEGQAATQAQSDALSLLTADCAAQVAVSQDEYGYTWIATRHDPDDLAGLVTDLHAVNSTLADAGYGPSLLCTVIGFTGADGERRRLGLVYLFKRGTFYPFSPTGAHTRDNALELQVRAQLGGELPVEGDLGRWFPIWATPAL